MPNMKGKVGNGIKSLSECKNNVRRGFCRDLDELRDYFDKNKLYTVEIGLTPMCQIRCIYCYASSTPDWTGGIPTKILYRLIDDLVECDVKQVNWGGGEPLCRPDWDEIMKYAQDCGLNNLLMTNGLALSNKKVAERVNDLVEMAFVHIDTLDPKIWRSLHDAPTQLLSNQISGVENLLETGFSPNDLALSITVTAPIIESDDYKKTIDWAYDTKGMAAILFPYRAYGFAKEADWLRPENRDMWKVYEYRNSKDGIPSGPGFGSKFYCGTRCNIGVMGDVLACSMIPTTKVGNIHKVSFKQLYERYGNMLTYAHLHDGRNIQGRCSSCKNNSFCWGCRALSFIVCGDYNVSDPICRI